MLWLTTALAQFNLTPLVSNLRQPVFLADAGDGSNRLFILEQSGRIRVLQEGNLQSEAFLDLSSKVSCCGERGLLGLAFHPDYKNNGLFYVNYTNTSGDTVVARYKVSPNPNRADANSAQVLLTIDQPFPNHNGGMLAFGPDGYLYIGMGDGGSGGDPNNNGQNLNTLLSKILRIDVNKSENGKPYAIPKDNPFVGRQGARPEIWSYGWRNPWRFSFDRQTGDLWVGDVGQNLWEEIDFEAAKSPGGKNYGWRLMEGTHCYNPQSGCNNGSLVLPLLEYGHDQGCSVTGGYRYRGNAVASLKGTYLYGDYCSGRIWSASEKDGKWTTKELLKTELRISSFAEDAEGELYVLDHNGAIYKITAK